MKVELRIELRRRRNAVENRVEKDKIITDFFTSMPAFEAADTVLLYYSSGSEVSTIDLFRYCLARGKKVAFPLCLNDEGMMDFFLVNDENDLSVGMYGIKAPNEDCRRLIATDSCLCVVPGLSFDSNGYRIGYGTGYYDRFLKDFPGVSVGLCYEELRLDSLPIGPHDIKVNYLITDKMIYNYNSKEDLKYG